MATGGNVQQCIQDCQQTAGRLRAMSEREPNPQVKSRLMEAAHHLDLCIVECQYSVQHL